MKTVSVIVPVYNTYRYLPKCLDSLVNQTLKDIEVIVVDDGSTDGSTDIIKEYEKAYPTIVKAIYKENGGQASARNIGIELSEGEFIGFLDSDDYVKYEMFERLYVCAKEHKADYVGCAYTDATYIGNELKILNAYVGNKVCTTNREMYIGGIVSPFINFYNGEMVRQSKVRFPNGLIYEDTAFWINMLPLIRKPAYVQEALAFRIRRENSTITIVKPEKVEQIFEVITAIINYYKENDYYTEYRSELVYFCSRILLCSSMKRIGSIQVRKDRNRLIDKTFEFLNMNLKDYKHNIYLKMNVKDVYIRAASPTICHIVLSIKNLLK